MRDRSVRRPRGSLGRRVLSVVVRGVVIASMAFGFAFGIDATRRIREMEADGPRTPIVALTANAFDEDRDACIAAGMDGFLTKPLDRERLAAALATAADAKAMAA